MYEKHIGIVMSGVEPKKVKALLLSDYAQSGDVVLNALVKIPYRQGFVVGVITNYRGMNDLYDNGVLVKNILQIGDEYEILQALRKKKEYFVADIVLISAFSKLNNKLIRVPINSPIPVGEKVYRLEDKDLSFGDSVKCFYLGRFYGENLLHPVYITDFQTLGEAYHFVIAGQTGSGKSTMAMMLMCLYANASKENGNPMNFVVLSPVSEFVQAFKGKKVAKFGLNIEKVFSALGYKIEIYGKENLVFDRWELLEELLRLRNVFHHLEIRHKSYTDVAVGMFIELAKKRWDLKKLAEVPERDIRKLLSSDDFVGHVYKQVEARNHIKQVVSNDILWSNFWQKFQELLEYFRENKGKRVSDLAKDLASNKERGRVVAIDIKYEGDLVIQSILLKEIVDTIRKEGQKLYEENPFQNLNTLVVLDEAHNFAPMKVTENNEYLERLKDSIVKAFVETRKFGIGWMAISTRISLLDRKLYEHARVKVIGYGLTTGNDREILREDFGKETIERYSSFTDPSDPISDRSHSFLIHGPITLLSRTEPELIQAFSSSGEFLQINNFPVLAFDHGV